MKRLLIGLLSITLLQPVLGMEQQDQPQKATAKTKKKKKKNRKKKVPGSAQTKKTLKIPSIDSLTKAIKEGDLHIVMKYIRAKGNLNIELADGMTPLKLAVKYERFALYEFMIQFGGATDEIVEAHKAKEAQKGNSNN